MKLDVLGRISGYLLVSRLLIHWFLLVFTFARNCLWLWRVDLRSERRAGFRRLIAGRRITDFGPIRSQLRRFLLFSNLVQFMRKQSCIFHTLIISRSVLDGDCLCCHLLVVGIKFILSLEGLLLRWGLLNFLLIRGQSVFHISKFYFDISLVLFVFWSRTFRVDFFIIEIDVARIDVVPMVGLNWASSVLVVSRITVGYLLTTVAHLVLSFAMRVVGILHHLVVMAVSKVKLVLLIRRRRIERRHWVVVLHMLSIYLLASYCWPMTSA